MSLNLTIFVLPSFSIKPATFPRSLHLCTPTKNNRIVYKSSIEIFSKYKTSIMVRSFERTLVIQFTSQLQN